MRTAFLLDVLIHAVIAAFQRRRLEWRDARHVIGRLVHVGITEHQDHPLRSGIDQLALRFEHRDQRAFAADQRARDVEAPVLAGKQLFRL